MPNMIDLDEADPIDMTVEEVRKFIGVIDVGDENNDFIDITREFDKAQGDVKSGNEDVRYVIIRVSP